METKPIRTLRELESEIERLKNEIGARELDLKQQVTTYYALIKTPLDWLARIKRFFGEDGNAKSDMISTVAQLGLPILLNSVIFKKSSLLVKGLLAFASQQVAKGITAETLNTWIEQLSAWLKKRKGTITDTAEQKD